MHHFKRIGIIASFALVVSFMVFPIHINAEKSVTDVDNEKKEVKEKRSKAEKKVEEILVEIEEIEQEMAELNSILKENEKQAKETKKDIEKVKKEIDKLEKKIEKRYGILKDRAKSYQESGGNAKFIDVLFNATDFKDLISRVSAISTITGADADLIEEQERDKKKVEEKKSSLEEMKEELETKREQLKEQKSYQKEAKKELQDKKAKLDKTVKKLKVKEEKLSDMKSKMTSATDASTNFATDTGNGEYGWPTVGGYISSPVGQRWGRMHKGIDIARTDRSTVPPIYAAESGTVQFAGHMNGYGNVVIVEHGDGMETLYAHMSKVKASNGQKVERGQEIGIMGTTGNSTGIHLHFEVHKNGNIENPIGYLNK